MKLARRTGKITMRIRISGFFLLLLVLGCGKSGFYPAGGQLEYSDGKPATDLEGFQIVFEGKAPDGKSYSATGTIDASGKFDMFTDTPGDGAPAGECKVLIQPKMIDSEREAPYPIDAKYRSFATSGLTAQVEAKSNRFTFQLERKKGSKK